MDDRGKGTSAAEAEAARRRLATGLPTLFASVFVAFVVVALLILGARYLL